MNILCSEYYLNYCETGFEQGTLDVVQIGIKNKEYLKDKFNWIIKKEGLKSNQYSFNDSLVLNEQIIIRDRNGENIVTYHGYSNKEQAIKQVLLSNKYYNRYGIKKR